MLNMSSTGSRRSQRATVLTTETNLYEQAGYIMSARQIDDLWHYDFILASQMLNLPLRQCSAKPSDDWGATMEDKVFQRLKAVIRTMWARAAEIFSVSNDHIKGHGLCVNDFRDKMSLTENSCHALGWLAVCPALGDCDTAHRYMRSPIGSNLYLGGPISLANWAPTSDATVQLRRSLSSLPELKNLYFARTVKPLSKGTEVLWNYGIVRAKEFPLHDAGKPIWIQPCCSFAGEADSSLSPPNHNSTVSATCRPLAPAAIRKRDSVITSYRHCTLCGLNIDQSGSATNFKPHVVRHHAVDICYGVYSEAGRVHGTAFLANLHAFCKILESLKSNGYHVVPACHFFRLSNTNILPSDAADTAKKSVFAEFQREAKVAFNKYQVIYLRGTHIPVCYEDILPSLPETSYQHISWEENSKPAHGSFSVKGKLSHDEYSTLERTIFSSVQDIIMYRHL